MLVGILEYTSQAIVYALLSAVTIELLLYAWRVQDPSLAIAFRVLVLAIPPTAPLVFSPADAVRHSDLFRQRAALLDLHNWLGPEPSLYQPAWLLLLVVMGVTTIALVGLDMVSFLRRLEAGHPHGSGWLIQPPARLVEVISRMEARGIRLPPVLMAPLAGPTAFTAGLLHPRVLVSPSIVELLDGDELEAVLAHEAAHVDRQDNWLGWLTFASRVVSFYNPVVQFTYHRIGHDVERVCDCEAGRATGKQLALASALIKVYRASRSTAKGSSGWSRSLNKRAAALENRARRALVEDRVERLVYPEMVRPTSLPYLRLALATAAVVALAYLVV
jgi:Zn-dependent protease with chaperone function